VYTDRTDAQAYAAAVTHAINKALPTLTRWAYHAPFHDIVSLVPPSAEVFKRIAEGPEPATDVCEQYRWIVDRLSGLVLRNWAQASLESEYDWRRGRRPANIPDSALIEINYTAEDLAVQIADNRLEKRVNDWDPLIEQVNNDRQPIEITSKRGDAVLMSRADYEALEETAYLLRAPANARRLLESLEQARSGERQSHDLL